MCLVCHFDVVIYGGHPMNIYDFDGTIYDGDSSIDFYKYCIRTNIKCMSIVPKVTYKMILYKMKMISKEEYKSSFFSFLKFIDNPECTVEQFWNKYKKKIKKFYIDKKKSSDIIISASPEFLLKPIVKKLGCNLIATEVNIRTGQLLEKNCYGSEKVERLKNLGINSCNEFYSDSRSDEPCKKIAKKAFLVHKNNIDQWL